MPKSTTTYWNVLSPENSDKWETIPGTSGMLEQLTLAIDEKTGDYTRLTRFKAGADTTEFGGKSHTYPEEIYIISGKLYDAAFEQWLVAGDFASRPPGEIHGPFICEEECLVMEVSYPSQSTEKTQQIASANWKKCGGADAVRFGGQPLSSNEPRIFAG